MSLESVKKSDFWKKKIRASIEAQDVDGDGFITRKDIDAIVQRYEDAGSPPEHIKELRENYENMYNIWGFTGENWKISIEDYLIMYVEKLEGTISIADKIFPLWFKQVDTNADGVISVEEWKVHNAAINIDPETAMKSFKAMDTNHDGVLSQEEFIAYHNEFFFSTEDKLKSSLLFGPL